MGPEAGTREYRQQVWQIFTVLDLTAESRSEIDQLAMMYVEDRAYSRAAICDALHRLKTHQPPPAEWQ